MQSHNLRIHDDGDVQRAKAILSRLQEYDRTSTHDRHSENDNPANSNQNYDSDSESESESDSGSSRGVPLGFIEDVEDDDDDADEESGCRVDGPYSHFEWGLDEPEFEGYPVFSDDEDRYDSGQEDYYDMGYSDDGEGW